MSDLIDRQAAIDAIRIFYADECALVDSIEEQLEKLPSAQPQRMKGRWIPHPSEEVAGVTFSGYRCSVCNYWKVMGIWNFCPNCGSDNRGEDDETD